MGLSRTENTTKNFASSILMQGIKLLLKFVNRTVVIYSLGMAYVGLDSVFSNILTLLSLSELGIGTAIIFDMYKPIASNDKDLIKSLVNFYRVIYETIGIVILGLGFCALPFLDKFATLPENVDVNIYAIYILFLLNTSTGYFFAHKKSLLNGYQQAYIDNYWQAICTIALNVAQIVLIIIFRNYYLYISLMIFSTLIENILVARYVNKTYPYIKEKYVPLQRDKKVRIFKNVGYLSVEKFAGTFLSGSDSIILSYFCGLIIAGIYSNYYMIIAGVSTFLGYFLTSCTSSIGNLISSESKEDVYLVFKKLRFAFENLNGFATVCLLVLLPKIMDAWVGDENSFSISVMILFVVYQYMVNNRSFIRVFKTAGGLFKNCFWLYFVETVLKICLAIVFVKSYGAIGIWYASIVSFVFTGFIMEPSVVYKNIFDEKVFKYYEYYFIKFLVVGIGYVFLNFVVEKIPLLGIVGLIVDTIVCIFGAMLYYLIIVINSEYFTFYLNMIKKAYTKIKRRLLG